MTSNSKLTNSDPLPQLSAQPNGFVRFQRIWAVFALALFAVTGKLWTPQTDFPQIPFLEILVDVPGVADWILLVAMAISLLVSVFTRSEPVRRLSLFGFALAATALISLNQHRLQPWAYQFVVFAGIMAAARPRLAVRYMRWIVVSIYIYSAISKFDYQFVHTVGNQMMVTIAGLLGQNAMDWSDTFRQRLVLGMPIGELLVGCGLLFPKTRKLAIAAAVLLHVVLLVTLLKLGHSPGVICWNVYFACQAVLLFRSFSWERAPISDELAKNKETSRYPLEGVATALTGFVLLFPLTQPFGICDHWLAWQVYSPCTSRAETIVLTESDTPFSQDPLAWSEEVFFAPVYPQARFHLAIAMAELQESETDYSIEIKGVADRWNGDRQTETLTGQDQMKMRASRFWLNSKPRAIWTERNRSR